MKFLKILLEGKVEEFKSKYTNKFGADLVERISNAIKPKYLDWLGKKVDQMEIQTKLPEIIDSLNKFDLLSSNLTKTDINQYINLSELLEELKKYNERVRRNYREVPGGVVVHEDERFFIVNPLNHESSCYYGKGTKWCTASSTDDQFNKYNQDGKLFYILDKKLKTDDPYYKVALLKKFEGDELWWDAQDRSFNKGWMIGTPELEQIRGIIKQYLEQQFSEQIKIWTDKENAKRERERLEKIRERQRIARLEDEANDRRSDDEWNLENADDDLAMKANALFNWLESNGDIDALSPTDKARLSSFRLELEQLEERQDNGEELDDEIEEIEGEISELESKIDIYHLIPTGGFYDLQEFEVINSDISDRRYVVGDASEMQSSAEEYVDGLIDDIGFNGFSSGFAESYLDDDRIEETAQQIYDDDVRNNPDVYFDESERQLSDKQEEQISIKENRIERLRQEVDQFNDMLDEIEDEEQIETIEEKIKELEDVIYDLESDIEDIKDSPDGEFPEELIDEKVSDLVDEAVSNPSYFFDNLGLSWEDYVDKEKFIEGVIDADGYGIVNGYDGNMDEIYVKDTLFYVGRID